MPPSLPTRFSPPVHEPTLARGDRRKHGIYYTPPEIARLIAELTLAPLQEQRTLRVLDPACGAGEILVAAQEFLVKSGESAVSLLGIDIDSQAVRHTRQRLADRNGSERIQIGDALQDDLFPPATFDAVIGNPPYVSIRELAKQRAPEEIAALRQRFRAARGNFDLYVLFIERALQWLRPGGRCGLIVPNKWATLDYARRCRELLLEHATIDQVIDLSAQRVFHSANVYPHLLVFSKLPARARSAIRVDGKSWVLQRSLSADAFVLSSCAAVESRAATQPLGSLARLSCGTPGYAAQAIGSCLVESAAAPPSAVPFITSGNIDRYVVRRGRVRYQGRVWRDPWLPLDARPVTEGRRTLFASQKIVIAGLSRRLEAAWDHGGLALGVQVFAATEFQLDPFYLLALLNSKLLAYLFRTRFAAKRLGGGYLAVNKGQLARLPIAVPPAGNRERASSGKRLAELADSLSSGQSPVLTAADAEIDQLVYQLYRLTRRQIAEIEAHFAELETATHEPAPAA